jgi:hypothetical protein
LIEEEVIVDSSNDTNEDSLYYFAHLTNHYLQLVKSSSILDMQSRHPMKFPNIADSSTNFHTFKEKEFFDTLHPASGTVLLGDGQTTLMIEGIRTVKSKIGENTLIIPGVCYIPSLVETIYSLFVHIQHPGHGLYSSFEDGLFIKFSTFQTRAIVGDNDTYIDTLPLQDNPSSISSDLRSLTSNPLMSDTAFCTQVQDAIVEETKALESILCSLRRYYSEVKTKRQLGLEVPASFRSSSTLQQNFCCFTPPRRAKTVELDTPLLET